MGSRRGFRADQHEQQLNWLTIERIEIDRHEVGRQQHHADDEEGLSLPARARRLAEAEFPQVFAERLREVSPEFERAGVCLAVENHDRFPAATLRRITRTPQAMSWNGRSVTPAIIRLKATDCTRLSQLSIRGERLATTRSVSSSSAASSAVTPAGVTWK